MKTILNAKLIEKLNGADFSVVERPSDSGNGVTLRKFTSAGQEVTIDADLPTGGAEQPTLAKLLELLDEMYESYDVSEQAYFWLDHTGHGKNGAPYDMMDVYADAEEARSFIKEAGDIIQAYVKANRKKEK